MKLSEAKLALTFDDVVLVPNYSPIKSRNEPDPSTEICGRTLKAPIIASPMNTVCEADMLVAIEKCGGIGVLHRYMSIPQQLAQVQLAIEAGALHFFVAVGATGDYFERAYEINQMFGVRSFCVDVANGDSEASISAVRTLREKIGCSVMAGNVCTLEGALRLQAAGATSIRVGIGPGSMCKTRVVTGHGVPQLTAIEECAQLKATYPNVSIIADGGIRNSGDIVKALAAGADAVMLGGLLAGTDETPGEIVEKRDVSERYDGSLLHRTTHITRMKKYAGMASEEGRSLGGWFDRTRTSFVPEGEATEVPYKGPVKDVVEGLVGGLKVGMSYSGSRTLQELRQRAVWARVTENGRVEGTPHGKV